MTPEAMKEYITNICRAARAAAPAVGISSTEVRNSVLLALRELLRVRRAEIEAANAADLEAYTGPDKMRDRLILNEKRIDSVCNALTELAALPDVLGEGTRTVRPNGLVISKIRVPLGVIGIVYEARPNVTVDAAALCIKTGNAVLLRGGKEAINTNRVLTAIIREALVSRGLPADAVTLVDDTTREGTYLLMRMKGLIDVLIPRGGAGLIRSVVADSLVPVIETGAGNCHIYIDATADLEVAVNVAVNAKMSRPSVCNAVETMLVHRDIAAEFLPRFQAAAGDTLELRCDSFTRTILPNSLPLTDEDYATEYNDYIIAIGAVSDISEAIAHINRYGTGHSEAIITRDIAIAERFKREVDAAAVYVNASTRFTDGGEFGLGAEIGISTQKLHARGPMGLRELTTDKYLIDGCGQVRI